MGIQELFKDPNSRPKAIAATLLLGGAIAYGAYQFWINREAVSTGVKTAAREVSGAAHKVGDKAGSLAHTVGDKAGSLAHKTGSIIESTYQRISKKIQPVKTRISEFKNLHLQRFVETKQAALKESDLKVLDFATLTRLQQLAIEVSEKDFRKVIKLNREQRRQSIEHDKPKYEEIVINGEQDFEEIFNENLKEILQECGVSQEKYNESLAEHVKTDENIYLVGAALYDVMLGRIPAVNEPVTPTKEYVIEIHNFMIDQYKKIFYRPIHKDYFTDVKEKMLLDKVHEKYAIEEEDIRKLRNNFDSIEVRELREKISTLISQDEATFGNFPAH